MSRPTLSQLGLTLPDQAGGRVLTIPTGHTHTHPQAADMPTWRVYAIVLSLMMFAQCFQYMIDFIPLYLLSKIWPFLMLPVFAWAVMSINIPYKVLYIATLFWVLGVTPMISILQLGNSFGAAMATTAKVWSVSFIFGVAGLLVILRPPRATLRKILIYMGAGTYILMTLLWVLVPARSYGGGDLDTKLFMYAEDRGYRIYMPMFFGIFYVFYLNRSFWLQPRIWKVVALVLCFVAMLTIYKERAAIGGAALAVVVGTVMGLRRYRGAALILLAVAGCLLLLYLVEKLANSPEIHQSLGGSLSVRKVTVAQSWGYISADPLRWIFGVGGTTRLGDVTLAKLFNNPMFFLTDIGWLGVWFEYGAIGALLLLAVHFIGLKLAWSWAAPDDPVAAAIGDYIFYLICVSTIYSPVFTPGELTTMMGLSYYLALGWRTPGPRYGSDAAQPGAPMPRQSARASIRPSGPLALPAPSGRASSG